MEDLQHGRSNILVLYGVGCRGVLETKRQHLLARQGRNLCESFHSVRTQLDRTGLPASAGNEISTIATDKPEYKCRSVRQNGAAPSNPGLASIRSDSEDKWKDARVIGCSGKLSDA